MSGIERNNIQNKKIESVGKSVFAGLDNGKIKIPKGKLEEYQKLFGKEGAAEMEEMK